MGRRAQGTGISRWGAWKGAHLPGTCVLKKALEMDTFLHRGPVKNHRGSFRRKLRDSWRALEMEHLSLWTLCEGNLERVSLTGDPKSYVEEGSGDRHLSP